MDYMLCNVDLLRQSADTINNISTRCDGLLRLIGGNVTALTDYDWHGDESAQFIKEFGQLEAVYAGFKQKMLGLSKAIKDFADRVDDVDSSYAARFGSI